MALFSFVKRHKTIDNRIQHPDHFTFSKVRTDEQGTIRLDFGKFKIQLERNGVNALNHLRLNMADLHNVRD